MNPFTSFNTEAYTFIATQGDGSEYVASGIFKDRAGMIRGQRNESYSAAPSLHIRPSEPFITAGAVGLVGNAVAIRGEQYRIEGATEGIDFDNGQTVFYRATLVKEPLWQSALPIE